MYDVEVSGMVMCNCAQWRTWEKVNSKGNLWMKWRFISQEIQFSFFYTHFIKKSTCTSKEGKQTKQLPILEPEHLKMPQQYIILEMSSLLLIELKTLLNLCSCMFSYSFLYFKKKISMQKVECCMHLMTHVCWIPWENNNVSSLNLKILIYGLSF